MKKRVAKRKTIYNFHKTEDKIEDCDPLKEKENLTLYLLPHPLAFNKSPDKAREPTERTRLLD